MPMVTMYSRALALCALLGVAADPWPVRHTKTNAEGNQFLEANKDKTGVYTTDSGMQYKQVWIGSGTDYPFADSACIVHFEAYKAADFCEYEELAATPPTCGPCAAGQKSTIHGLETALGCRGPQIDSSDADGVALFTPSQMMAPIKEAMEMMVEGDKWNIYFDSPAEGPHSVWYSNDAFVFTVHIVQIIGSRNAKYSPPSNPPPPLAPPSNPPSNPPPSNPAGR